MDNRKKLFQIEFRSAEQNSPPLPPAPSKVIDITPFLPTIPSAPPDSKKTKDPATLAKPSDYIHSLADIHKIQEYFLYKKDYRELALFTLGITTGLRISDLLSLRISDVLMDDMCTFRSFISIQEIKTGKPTVSTEDVLLITEAAQEALSLYFEKRNWDFSKNDFVFYSQKPRTSNIIKKSKNAGEQVVTQKGDHSISSSYARRKMKEAQEALALPYHISTHTMRKTFLNIVAGLVNHSNINLNPGNAGYAFAQIAARHEDFRTTMRYLCKTKEDMAAIRKMVSDYILGRVSIDVLDEKIKFYV